MIRSGVIFGIVAFVMTLLTGNLVCGTCFLLLIGLGAGFVANRADRPLENQGSLLAGAGAGALAGAFMLPAQLLRAIWAADRGVMPGGAALYEFLEVSPPDAAVIWVSQIAAACCLGLFNLALLAGAGAAGGALWFQRRGGAPPDEPIPPAL